MEIKVIKCHIANNEKRKLYPSAELVLKLCYEDYKRVIETYDKIYNKTNIALAFTGVLLLVIIGELDYTVLIKRVFSCTNPLEFFSLLLYSLCSLGSALLIIISSIKLLFLLKSTTITVFNSISLRTEELYNEEKESTALWTIEKITTATEELKGLNDKKNKKLNNAIVLIAISLICYSIAIIIKKGV